MASGLDTHTHTYPHESNFKKPDPCQPVTGVHLALRLWQ